MTDEKQLELDEDILFRGVGGEGVVVDQRRSSVMVVNPVALRILELLREGLTVSAISNRLADEFDAEPLRIAADVALFIEELKRRDIVH